MSRPRSPRRWQRSARRSPPAGPVPVRLLREVLGSILAGVLVGGRLSLYLRFVKRELVVFAVVLVFATAAAGQALGF